MKVGDTLYWERSFSEQDVRDFARFSGDEGNHHLEPDSSGRLLVHGLLTATLPTKIGGDLNFIARELKFEFVRPVFAGDNIRCEVTLIHFEAGGPYHQLKTRFVCRNQHEKEVLSGEASGVIRNLLG